MSYNANHVTTAKDATLVNQHVMLLVMDATLLVRHVNHFANLVIVQLVSLHVNLETLAVNLVTNHVVIHQNLLVNIQAALRV
jgi:hypothetical protein